MLCLCCCAVPHAAVLCCGAVLRCCAAVLCCGAVLRCCAVPHATVLCCGAVLCPTLRAVLRCTLEPWSGAANMLRVRAFSEGGSGLRGLCRALGWHSYGAARGWGCRAL